MLDERYTLDLTDGLDVQENRIQLWESNANVNSQFMLTNNPNGTKSILPAGSATRALDIYSVLMLRVTVTLFKFIQRIAVRPVSNGPLSLQMGFII